MAALNQLAEIQALRNAMNELTDQQIADKLGDQRTTIMNRFGVGGTQKLSRSAAAMMIIFIILSMVAFMLCSIEKSSMGEKEKSSDGEKIVNGLYFATVTLTTTGYGDFVPKTSLAKFITCLLMLMGAYVLSLSNKAVGEVLAKALCSHPHRRLSCAVATVVVLIFVGAGAAFVLDGHSLVTYPNSIYFAITSVTGVGYGDLVLEGNGGRIFVSIWLIASSLLFQRAFECTLESFTGFFIKKAIDSTQKLQEWCVSAGQIVQQLHHAIKGVLERYGIA